MLLRGIFFLFLVVLSDANFFTPTWPSPIAAFHGVSSKYRRDPNLLKDNLKHWRRDMLINGCDNCTLGIEGGIMSHDEDYDYYSALRELAAETAALTTPEGVLSLWFGPPGGPVVVNQTLWFRRDSRLDRYLNHIFGDVVQYGVSGGLQDWEAQHDSTLAKLILLQEIGTAIQQTEHPHDAAVRAAEALRLARAARDRWYRLYRCDAHRLFVQRTIARGGREEERRAAAAAMRHIAAAAHGSPLGVVAAAEEAAARATLSAEPLEGGKRRRRDQKKEMAAAPS